MENHPNIVQQYEHGQDPNRSVAAAFIGKVDGFLVRWSDVDADIEVLEELVSQGACV